ncbi:hypothetical protein Tco_0139294 [Tanacetum coccineum]
MWLSRNLEQLPTSKLHAMGNVSSIFTIPNQLQQIARDICIGVDLEPDEWIKDSGCSKHMTGNQKLFSSYKAYNVETTYQKLPKVPYNVAFRILQTSKANIILNKHTRKIEESLNVTFDETPPPSKTSPLVDDDLNEDEAIKVTEKKFLENNIEDETLEIDKIVNIKASRNHPLENVIGNLNQRILSSQAQNQSNFFCFISTIEPKNVNEALTNKSWIMATQEELNQFIANDLLELVQPRNMKIIGTKWVFRNKLDENEMLKKFGLEESKPMKTPMSSDTKLTKDEEYELVDSTKKSGKKRPCESNASSSSTTLNHPSSSRPLDDTIDENDDESFHSNSSSPSQNISSSSNVVSRVRQNPPHESHNLNTYLSETINLQTQQRDAHREGLRSIGQALKNMMGGKRK